MHHHVVDDDLVIGRAEERGKLLIQAAHQVTTFEVMKITKLHVVCDVRSVSRSAKA